MTALILRRLLQLPLILVVIFLVTLTLAWWIPGNPLQDPDRPRPDPAVERAMLEQYNLDSRWSFAWGYLTGAVRGDLGPSLTYPEITVNEILGEGLPVSAALGLVGLAMALLIGLSFGVLGVLKPGTPLDWLSLGVAVLGVSLPTFVTGSILLAIFAGMAGLDLIGGWDWPGWNVTREGWGEDLLDMLGYFWLPALTLAVTPAAYIARLIRVGLAETLSSDYIRTARAKGVAPARVILRHAMRVAFLPVLSFLGPAAATTLTGSFVVEKIYDIPGLGEHFVNAVLNKDLMLIMGVVLVFSTLLIFFNLAVDLAYAWLDPRIDYA